MSLHSLIDICMYVGAYSALSTLILWPISCLVIGIKFDKKFKHSIEEYVAFGILSRSMAYSANIVFGK